MSFFTDPPANRLHVWRDKARYQLSRYRWLRAYYKDHHLDLTLPGCRLADGNNATLGYLEAVRLHQGRLHLRGWTLASGIGIRLGRTQIWRQPREERDDVAAALGCDKHVGFRASLPFEEGPLLLELEGVEEKTESIRVELHVTRARYLAERRLKLRFWRDAVPLLPIIAKGLLRNDPDLPRRIKTALRLGQTESEAMLDPRFLEPADRTASPSPPPEMITVIIPVFNAFELLAEMLDRVMAHTDLPFRLILIEDQSTDPRVRPWLRDWVARHPDADKIELRENETNLGFIGSVNRGFAAAQHDSGPVILLNSDAMVPPRWASRLVAPLGDPSIATTTPLSNDAEIYTAPVICARAALEPGQLDAIDVTLRERIAKTSPQVVTPTGVGFCIAVQREWLQRLGGFDPVFGRGYGEEVDWCRRAVAKGGRHVAVPNLFVEHRGGASFGPSKLALVQKNNAIISERYPGYDRIVQDFIRDDPLITPRLVTALAWADSLRTIDRIPIHIAHSLGGGAENYLQDRVRSETVSLVLRLGGAWRYRLELDTPLGRVIGNSDDIDLAVRLLTPLRKRRIVYSCAVGDPDLGDIPDLLLRLSDGAALDILFHDFLPLSPSYTLLDHDGIYRGIPPIDSDDPAHQYRRADGSTMSLADWRAAWGRVIDASDRLIVFSRESARIVESVYPKAKDRLHFNPHALPHAIPRLTAPKDGRIVLGVLGAIGPQKGAAVLSALSRKMHAEQDASLALIGRIAPGYPLADDVPVHGIYAIEDIPHLAARYGVTHWLIPSIWPETFSYTVHECLATGLPTLAFDLGAQGEAVRNAANGIPVPFEKDERTPECLAERVAKVLRATRAR
ncbi:glycosyltransferase [Pararhodobacter sp. SW119]|uniref:glycosyltransferase family 2 protein n=1 Tax=Pararhodobacter sp. SW119 TaxID=2780075 RepID=UPI001ADEF261|nr:glycosyltransferase [Pararhodobacter sp. SW119]